MDIIVTDNQEGYKESNTGQMSAHTAIKNMMTENKDMKANWLNFNELGMQLHATAVEKGFYEVVPTFGERIALMHSELSEALEADRKDLPSDKLPGRTGIEEEFADCIIRILEYCAYKNIDIHTAILEKAAYNKLREYKHGGKKY